MFDSQQGQTLIFRLSLVVDNHFVTIFLSGNIYLNHSISWRQSVVVISLLMAGFFQRRLTILALLKYKAIIVFKTKHFATTSMEADKTVQILTGQCHDMKCAALLLFYSAAGIRFEQ